MARPLSTVLFIIQTGSQFYDTRLRWIAETWGSELNRASVVAIGDKPGGVDNKINIQVTKCPQNHGEGGCCKIAETIITAYNMMAKNPSLEWMFYSDDDAYIRPDAMQQVLSKEDSAGQNGKGAVYGVVGCYTPKCRFGICGGGGFAASREAVRTLVESDGAANLLRKMMQLCKECDEAADVAAGQAMLHQSIKLAYLPGLFGDRFQDKRSFEGSLTDKDTPLMYHLAHIKSRGQMEFMQAMFHRSVEKYPAFHQGAANSTSQDCASYRNYTVCLNDGRTAPDNAPWQRSDRKR
eukprot:TRINITY_DN9700_c0_g1_i1.p1 TRINITY_DN9700_c0_g1~~TRINITY_DN9700_c0_g1_i1.p1  ORF type:complete len:294 (+),score=60.27 TRINITY_DN9700_c0_g1_i1:43-924(+)